MDAYWKGVENIKSLVIDSTVVLKAQVRICWQVQLLTGPSSESQIMKRLYHGSALIHNPNGKMTA